MEEIRDKIIKIQELAFKCTDLGFHCFTGYSGHVQTFDIQIYDGEWAIQKESVRLSINVDRTIESLNFCDKVLYHLAFILNNNRLDHSKFYSIGNNKLI